MWGGARVCSGGCRRPRRERLPFSSGVAVLVGGGGGAEDGGALLVATLLSAHDDDRGRRRLEDGGGGGHLDCYIFGFVDKIYFYSESLFFCVFWGNPRERRVQRQCLAVVAVSFDAQRNIDTGVSHDDELT